MLSVAAPFWLAGLAVIPLVWWLHRLGDPNAAAPVSAVFLFSTQADETKTADAGRSGSLDPTCLVAKVPR